jgi:Flp pilus assembly protein TadG
VIPIISAAWHHLRSARRGQALVETAIALPLLLLMSLAAFDVGRALLAHIALTEGTQEGSLYAAHEYNSFPSDTAAEAAVRTRVRTSSNSEPVTLAIVDTMCSNTPTPGTVDVRTAYELPVISPPALAMFGPTITLSVEVTAANFNEDACPP